MILGSIDDSCPNIPEADEIKALKEKVEKLEKQMELYKYGLILFALYYMFKENQKWKTA